MTFVRRAAPDDLDSLMPLWHQLEDTQRAMRQLPPAVDPDEHFAREFLASVNDDRCAWLVVEDDGGAIAGMAYLHDETPSRMSKEPVIELSRVCVADDARGRGIGRLLVAEAEKIARTRGVRFLSAKIFSRNAEASRFWEQAGFDSYLEVRLRTLDPQ